MLARTLTLAAVLALGCKPEKSGRFDEVRLYYFKGLDTHPVETIDAAEEVLGLDLIVADESPKAVLVFYIEGALPPPDSPLTGEEADADACGRALWAENRSRTLAHELGHALSLEHVDDPSNLMFDEPNGGTDLEEEQIDTMRWAAWWLENKCARQ